MAGKCILRYLPASQDDLLSNLDYIALDSPSRALRFINEIEEQIGCLQNHPELGRIPRHPRLRRDGYRVLIVESYLVFYIVRGRTIEIHRVVRGSRNLDHLL